MNNIKNKRRKRRRKNDRVELSNGRKWSKEYLKLYKPWIPEDRAKLRKLGVQLPYRYTVLD